MIAHPTDELYGAGALVTLAGPALFPGGSMVCAARLGQAQSPLRAVAVRALLASVPLASGADGLLVSALPTAFLAVLVVAETLRGTAQATAS